MQTVAHIDELTRDLIKQFPKDCKMTLIDTGENGPLLADLLAMRLPSTVTIMRGTSVMVCKGVVTPDVGPPAVVGDATIAKMDKVAAQLRADMKAVLVSRALQLQVE